MIDELDLMPRPTKIEQLETYNECMIAKVKTFAELRYALDEAESRMRHLARQVDAIGSTIGTWIDFHERWPFEGRETNIVRFRRSMVGRRKTEDIIDDVIKRRFIHDPHA